MKEVQLRSLPGIPALLALLVVALLCAAGLLVAIGDRAAGLGIASVLAGAAALFCLALLGLLALSAWQWHDGPPLSANLLQLLPSDSHDALEQLATELLLQCLHVPADGALGDAQALRRLGEGAEACRHLEGAQGVQRWQPERHRAPPQHE